MYTFEDYKFLTKRYKPGVKNVQDTYFRPKLAFDASTALIKFSNSAICHYDKKGNLKKWEDLDNVESCHYIYKDGLLVTIKQYLKGVLTLINIITYDGSNRVIKETINEPQKTPFSKSQFITYDYDKPYIILKSSYSFGFSDDYFETKIFNNKNEIIEEKLEDLESVMQHSKYIYNQKGQIIKDITLQDGEVSYILNWTFYNNGYTKTIGKDYFKYKFDKNGNLIEKARYCEFGLCNVLKREIQYY